LGHASVIARTLSLMALATAACALSARANAQEATNATTPFHLALVRPSCAANSIDFTAFAAMLRVELGTFGTATIDLVLDAESAPASDATVLTLEFVPCGESSSRVVVRAVDASERDVRERTVDLTDTEASSRTRVLALAVAELLRGATSAPAAPRPHAEMPPPPVVQRPVPPRVARSIPLLRFRALASVEARAIPRFALFTFGGRAGLAITSTRTPLRATFAVGTLYGTASSELGSIHTSMAFGSLGGAAVWTAPSCEFALGPRVEVGAAWASGEPIDASVHAATIIGPVVTLAVDAQFALRVGPHVRPFVNLAAGTTAVDLVALANSAPSSGFSGVWLAAGLGTEFE
jgi:hypothetical protein